MRPYLIVAASFLLGVLSMWLWSEYDRSPNHYSRYDYRAYSYDQRSDNRAYEEPAYPVSHHRTKRTRRALPPCDWECGDWPVATGE